MIGKKLITLMVLSLATTLVPYAVQSAESNGEKEYKKPGFEKDIQRFEAEDRKQPPPQGAIVGIGSSSMKHWHGEIKKDLAPLTIIPRGFGGSNMNEALHYVDKIVLPYKPRAILLYEGDNDISQGISPQKIHETFMLFVNKVHGQLPECRIYFLAIKPSIKRWAMWPKMKEANDLIAAECQKDKRLFFVDVAAGMLDEKGEPKKSIFLKDNLHMNREGYVIWRDILKPILLASELQYEAKKPATAK